MTHHILLFVGLSLFVCLLAGCGKDTRITAPVPETSVPETGYIISGNRLASLSTSAPYTKSIRLQGTRLQTALDDAVLEAQREGWAVHTNYPLRQGGLTRIVGGKPRDSGSSYLLQLSADKDARVPGLTVRIMVSPLKRTLGRL